MKSSLLLLSIFFVTGTSFSQAANDSSATSETNSARHSFLKASVDYYSNNVYLGRKDVEQQSLIMPSLGYYHKSGLYVNASAGYIPQPGYQRFDMASFEAGYEYSGDKFYGSVAYAGYKFNDSSNAINSAVNSTLELYADYDLDFVTIGTGLDLSFVNKTDVILNPGISHTFYLANDHLNIAPAINMFAATQNFYQSYLVKSKTRGRVSKLKLTTGHGSGRGRGTGTGSTSGGTTSGTTTNVQVALSNQFKIMDYEISVPFEYSLGNFDFNLKPEYIIPVNPGTVDVNNATVTETLSNSFVIVAGISYKFGRHS